MVATRLLSDDLNSSSLNPPGNQAKLKTLFFIYKKILIYHLRAGSRGAMLCPSPSRSPARSWPRPEQTSRRRASPCGTCPGSPARTFCACANEKKSPFCWKLDGWVNLVPCLREGEGDVRLDLRGQHCHHHNHGDSRNNATVGETHFVAKEGAQRHFFFCRIHYNIWAVCARTPTSTQLQTHARILCVCTTMFPSQDRGAEERA